MPSSRGGDRRVAALVDALRPHLPDPGVRRVPAPARAAHLATRRSALDPSRPIVVVTRTDAVLSCGEASHVLQVRPQPKMVFVELTGGLALASVTYVVETAELR